MTQKTEDQPDVTAPGAAGTTRAETRADKTRQRIFDAVTDCLDQSGYAETSINRVQTAAGVSRGALTHHFPSKEEMMVRTLEHLLAPVRGPEQASESGHMLRKGGAAQDLPAELHRLWARVINTREGRAVMEILVASRTDETLRTRITSSLWDYNDAFNRNIANLYTASSGEDLALLWSICRSFMRGLHSQAPYERDPEIITKMVDLFARIMSPHLATRPGPKE